MDLDMEIQKDLTPLLQGCDVALAEDVEGAWQSHSNCLMASRPRHPMWLECVREMKKRANRWYPLTTLQVVNTTGPGLLSHVAKRYQVCTLPRVLVNQCTLCGCSKGGDASFVNPLLNTSGSWIQSPKYGIDVYGLFCKVYPWRLSCLVMCMFWVVYRVKFT